MSSKLTEVRYFQYLLSTVTIFSERESIPAYIRVGGKSLSSCNNKPVYGKLLDIEQFV